ncbi:PREDICTED: pentatricopeptide repeat domain-containing protein 3, mitochondrial-like [Acropora digitifera]|uniref:pentatricopeptide repeat domain-containing protein 3, mitochondrial-like n=1 Tax=Acropora digitifera TaxID=70779 RepID=UPI00077A4A12|nr:PREDICTED: pentatricopeptide repeat domain-containing protein 3, mitochondrial-like [Acropora digitifera]
MATMTSSEYGLYVNTTEQEFTSSTFSKFITDMETSSAKKRDPLAVLKILASTVKPVPNLSNPEFVEDIFLLPRSKDKQDACLAAKQSGRKAAEFVISRCPGIFPLRKPNPEWISGLAKATDSKTESDLQYFIKATDARNAILSFERLKEQGVEVSLDTQNDLLDLTAQRLGNIPAKQVFGFEEVSQESNESLGKGLEEDVGDSESDVLDREEVCGRDFMDAYYPTLESYNQLIRAEYISFWEKKKQSRSSDDHRLKGNQSVSPAVLNKVITYLESLPKLPPLSDPEDGKHSISLLCVDAKLAIRIFKLFEKQDNASYLGEKRGLFYSAFLLTLTSSDADFSLIYDYYKDIVPQSLLCVDAKLAIRIFKLFEKQDNASYLGEKRGLF